jgi:hypothetical protein
LLQAHVVSAHRAGAGRHIERKVDVFFIRFAPQAFLHFPEHALEIQHSGADRYPAPFDSGEVQEIVDEPGLQSHILQDYLKILPHLGGQSGGPRVLACE